MTKKKTSKTTQRSKEEVAEILDFIQDQRARCVQPRIVRRSIRDQFGLTKEMGKYYYDKYSELMAEETKTFDSKKSFRELFRQCEFAIARCVEESDFSTLLQWQKFIKETFLDTAPNSTIPKEIHYVVMSEQKVEEEKQKNQKTFERDTKPNDEDKD